MNCHVRVDRGRFSSAGFTDYTSCHRHTLPATLCVGVYCTSVRGRVLVLYCALVGATGTVDVGSQSTETPRLSVLSLQ